MAGRWYIEAYDYIIIITVKEDMLNTKIQKPTDKELGTSTTVELNSDLPRNTE